MTIKVDSLASCPGKKKAAVAFFYCSSLVRLGSFIWGSTMMV